MAHIIYKVKTKRETITDNKILPQEGFGGWQAMNEGDTPCTVNGVRLGAKETFQGLDFSQLAPNVIWDESITVKFDPIVTTKRLILIRMKYTPEVVNDVDTDYTKNALEKWLDR